MLEEISPLQTAGASNEMETENINDKSNPEYQAIVDKLQNMTKEELFEFVAKASEEEKEKIIKILDSVVEEEPQEETKTETPEKLAQQTPFQPIQPIQAQMQTNLQGQTLQYFGTGQQGYQQNYYYLNPYAQKGTEPTSGAQPYSNQLPSQALVITQTSYASMQQIGQGTSPISGGVIFLFFA